MPTSSDDSNSVLSGYLTREELARDLHITVRTLERWEALRTGPPVVRLGRRPMYCAESVAAWLKSREQPMVREGRKRRAA